MIKSMYRSSIYESLGEIETRTLQLDGDFRGIDLAGSFSVAYVPGEDCAVEIKTHAEVFDLLEYNIEDGIFNLGIKPRTTVNTDTLLITIQAPELELVSIAGACKFTAKEGIKAEAMLIDVSGASNISIKGAEADRMALDISGASKITMADLNLNHFNMSVSGASNIKLTGRANESKIEVDGASNLNIKEFESPVLTTETSGLSRIVRK